MTLPSSDLPAWKQLPDLPDPEGFAGSFAGISHDALIVAGGANFPEKPMWEGGPKTWTDRVFVLASPQGDWVEAGKLPFPCAYGASVSTPDGVVCLGGCDREGHRSEVTLLSWEQGRLACTTLPSLPVPLANMGAVLMGERIYVLGGSRFPGEQDAENALYSLDLSANAPVWQEEAPLPGKGRFLFEMAVFEDSLYVLGGIALQPAADGKKARELLREAWSYSSDLGWQRLPDLPRFCAAAPAPAPVSLSGKVYLLGGDDGSRAGFTPVQEHPGFNPGSLVFDIRSLSWADLGAIPAARAVLPCVQWQGAAILVNGELRPGKRSNQIWSVTLP